VLPLRRWLGRLAGAAAPPPAVATARMHGLEVRVENTRPDVDTADVLARLGEALGLIAGHTPHYWRHVRRDFTRLLVARYPCRGAYFPDTGTCLVELTFVVNRDFTPAQVAATVLHEGMHARLHRLGFPLEMEERARQERFCRRAEVEFGRLVPGGGPVVERALGILADATDAEVAPVIDPALAARRVAAADAAARGAAPPPRAGR
jgi:hypothetical protein